MSGGRSVCVFCGSRKGSNPAFLASASDVGSMLARRNWRLVYGAGDLGIMGAVSKAASTNGGSALGVIPRHLLDVERSLAASNSVLVTETMHQRKETMFKNSDAFVLLPGGAGSLDEMFEMLTWRQLKLHDKPLLVLNVAGYWQPFLGLVDHVIRHEFADADLAPMLEPVDSVAQLEARLAQHLA